LWSFGSRGSPGGADSYNAWVGTEAAKQDAGSFPEEKLAKPFGVRAAKPPPSGPGLWHGDSTPELLRRKTKSSFGRIKFRLRSDTFRKRKSPRVPTLSEWFFETRLAELSKRAKIGIEHRSRSHHSALIDRGLECREVNCLNAPVFGSEVDSATLEAIQAFLS